MEDQLFSEFFNQKLKERRLTLMHLSQATGISSKHLEAFSHGRFDLLPAKPYLRGYFMRLGQILDFDPSEWWERIQADDSIAHSGKKDILPKNRFHSRRSRALAGISIVAVFLIGYLGFRATKIIGKPSLDVTEPAAELSRVTESHIFIAGKIKNGNQVLINGEQVAPEADGSFHKDVSLQPGMNDIEISAKKTLGRTTSVMKRVYYETSPIQILVPEGGHASSSEGEDASSSAKLPKDASTSASGTNL